MNEPTGELLLEMYVRMLRVRLFEERARELFANARIPGFLHTSVGQEAVAVGVATALRRDDYILSTHRGHGHLVAKGGALRGLMAELYGKANGICHGKGGTMHIADVSVGYLGANGVLASGCVLAPGVGLSIRHRKSDQVVVTLFGDGAANRGPFHEGVNMAALWKLPVIFVCENNRWASTTAHALSTAGASARPAGGSIAARAAGYGIPGESVDGNDVLAVWRAVSRARARAAQGPSLIEAHTIRWVGHFEGDGQAYRGKDEVAEGRRTDPIARQAALLAERGLLDAAGADDMRRRMSAEIDDAVSHAEASPLPEPHEALTDLFAEWSWRE
ncbi:MAG: thiamine pyrophosphate-dependent dehydrogenase E1 component subunit alpha [Candidatus Rokubacteria bacterium]|nr:thiamine pyrophosphate-dependent dehydrogenase E1 component subunit alpha [Candidatus Rokubacteria bacterium]